jgi:hypothetical protein
MSVLALMLVSLIAITLLLLTRVRNSGEALRVIWCDRASRPCGLWRLSDRAAVRLACPCGDCTRHTGLPSLPIVYWIMTLVHTIHLTIGIGAFLVLMGFVNRMPSPCGLRHPMSSRFIGISFTRRP